MRSLRDLRSNPAHADHHSRHVLQFQKVVTLPVPFFFALIDEKGIQAACERQKHGHSVVGDVRTLHDPAVGQHNTALQEFLPAVSLDAGAVGLHPLELLGLCKLVFGKAANHPIRVHDLTVHIFPRPGENNSGGVLAGVPVGTQCLLGERPLVVLVKGIDHDLPVRRGQSRSRR